MAFKFLVWLRETIKLYLRYMVVGLVAIPFAAGAAWAIHAGWNQQIVVPVLMLLGLTAVAAMWRRWSKQQTKVEVLFDAEWADLLKAGTLPITHLSVTLDEDTAQTWKQLLVSSVVLVEGESDIQVFRQMCLSHNREAIKYWNVGSYATLEQLMKGRTNPTTTSRQSAANTSETPHISPLEALLRGSQPLPLASN